MPMNQSTRYDSVAQALHWTTALVVAALLIMGKAELFDADHPGSVGFMWHGSLGVLLLALVAARLLWRLVRPPPSFPATMTRLGRIAARAMHASLYVLLVAMSLSGWLAASSEGARVNFFNVATLPRWELPGSAAGPTAGAQAPVSTKDGEDQESPAKEAHELVGDALLILVGLHFLAALKHQFIDRDGLIRRMLPSAGAKSLPTAGQT
jgi:cytochrome b561